jgi:hypothetical protein
MKQLVVEGAKEQPLLIDVFFAIAVSFGLQG